VSLANSLTTVDSLFSSVSGHTHSGAHQGGALTAASIPDGSITSAKIADGTIATGDIAPNATSQLIANFFGGPTFNTTTTGSWIATPVTATGVSSGAPVRVEFMITLAHSAAGAVYYVALMLDGVTQANASRVAFGNANQNALLSYTYYLTLSAASHTFAVGVNNQTAGTLSIDGLVGHGIFVTEQKR